MLVCPGFPVLHAGEILLLPQAVLLVPLGVKVAAVLLWSQSYTIWNISGTLLTQIPVCRLLRSKVI